MPPIPKVEREGRTILPQEQLSSSAQASFEITRTSVEEAMFWDCSVDLATVSKMPEGPRPNAVTKRAMSAWNRQHGRRRMSSGTHVTETTVCSFRREVSATLTAICEDGNHIVRDESCLHRGATAFTNDRKWASGSIRSTRTNARQLHPLDRVTPSAGEAKKRRQPSTVVQEKWTDFGVLCALQFVSGLAGWHDEPRASNAKWYKEWKGTEWRDSVLADLVRPTLEGLILACFDDAEGIVDCVDTHTDGRRILEVKDTLTVRTRESEQKLKISPAALCLTEADSEYLVEPASVFAETLGDSAVFSQSDLGLVLVQLLKAVQSQRMEEDDASGNLEHVEIPGEERKPNKAGESLGESSDPRQD